MTFKNPDVTTKAFTDIIIKKKNNQKDFYSIPVTQRLLYKVQRFLAFQTHFLSFILCCGTKHSPPTGISRLSSYLLTFSTAQGKKKLCSKAKT